MTDSILMTDHRSMVHSVLLAPFPLATARKYNMVPATESDAQRLAAYEAENDVEVEAMPKLKLKDTNILTGDL
jgi:hypothetical protein